MDAKRLKTSSWTLTSPRTVASDELKESKVNKSPELQSSLGTIVDRKNMLGSPRLTTDRSHSAVRSLSGGINTTPLQVQSPRAESASNENNQDTSSPTVIVSRRKFVTATPTDSEPLSGLIPQKRSSEKASKFLFSSSQPTKISPRLIANLPEPQVSDLETSEAPTTTPMPAEGILPTKQDVDETPQSQSQTTKDRPTPRGPERTLQHQKMHVALIAPHSCEELAAEFGRRIAKNLDKQFCATLVLRTFFHAMGGDSEYLKTDALSKKLHSLENDDIPEYLKALWNSLGQYLDTNDQKMLVTQCVASITFYDQYEDKSQRDQAIENSRLRLGKELELIKVEVSSKNSAED